MGRAKRADEAGAIYRMLNRASRRATIFHRDADYEAFEQIIAETLDRVQLKLFSPCLLPNHWHLVVSPAGRWRDESLRAVVGIDGYAALQRALPDHR